MIDKKRVFFSVIVIALSGCNDSQVASCPSAGQSFFERSVHAYFSKHPPAIDLEQIKILPGARYDEHTHWWIVPIEMGEVKLDALLSCDGHLELSGRR